MRYLEGEGLWEVVGLGYGLRKRGFSREREAEPPILQEEQRSVEVGQVLSVMLMV
jgi:hypothetical protein